MSCTQTLNGILRNCLPNAGGVRKVWLANRTDIASYNVTTDGDIDQIVMVGSAVFKEYQFSRNTAYLSSNYAVNAENGTRYVETDLVMVFNRMDTAKRLELAKFVQGELSALVEDNNGRVWYLGFDHPVVLSGGDALSGTAYADRNGYSVTLHDVSAEMPHEFSGDFDDVI